MKTMGNIKLLIFFVTGSLQRGKKIGEKSAQYAEKRECTIACSGKQKKKKKKHRSAEIKVRKKKLP